MKGRKSTPSNLKLIKGTYRTDRENAAAPTPVQVLPSAPDGLSARAVEWFGRLTSRLDAMGCASASHTEMLALAARRMAEIDACDALIEKHGVVYESVGKDGAVLLKPNPAVNMRSDAMRQAQSLLAEFGLSLSSVSKVSVPQKPAEGSWSKFA